MDLHCYLVEGRVEDRRFSVREVVSATWAEVPELRDYVEKATERKYREAVGRKHQKARWEVVHTVPLEKLVCPHRGTYTTSKGTYCGECGDRVDR